MPANEPYEPPMITVLGTLHELTLGTGGGASDPLQLGGSLPISPP